MSSNSSDLSLNLSTASGPDDTFNFDSSLVDVTGNNGSGRFPSQVCTGSGTEGTLGTCGLRRYNSYPGMAALVQHWEDRLDTSTALGRIGFDRLPPQVCAGVDKGTTTRGDTVEATNIGTMTDCLHIDHDTTRDFLDLLSCGQLQRDCINSIYNQIREHTDNSNIIVKQFENSLYSISCGVKKIEGDLQYLIGKRDVIQQQISDYRAPVIHEIQNAGQTLSPKIEPFSFSEHNLSDRDFDTTYMDELHAQTTYTHDFKSRKAAYYSDEFDYKYSGTKHRRRPFSENPCLQRLLRSVQDILPNQSFNSAMIHAYEDGSCGIPSHSDDEEDIVPGSDIITISLGETRTMVIRSRIGAPTRQEIELEHGSILQMSRLSQDYYDHGIPSEHGKGFRMSVTLRLLRDPRAVASPTPVAPPKRVLVLTDSRNASFDPAIFEKNLIGHKRILMCIADINKWERDIAAADIVIIACGLNDIVNRNSNPQAIFNIMTHFIERFKDTMFLFACIEPIAVHVDKFNFYNPRIAELNHRMFQLGLRCQNFKYFDNLRHGMAHLSSDGIHLTDKGKECYSRSWLTTTLLYLGLRQGPLPLRRAFREEYNSFLWSGGVCTSIREMVGVAGAG